MLPLFFLLSIQALASPQSPCDASAPTCVPYRAHLEYASHAPLDSVWFDLRYIATPDETSAWFTLSTATERRAYLERFWDARAVRAAVSSDVRYAEHVRRLERARRWYDRDYRHRLIGALGANAWYATVEPMLKPASRPDSLYPVDLDDRGLVYMRFGEPDRIERCQGSVDMRTFEAGEAWVYAGSYRSETRVVFFATRGRAGDVQIVFSPGQTICSEREMRDLRDLVALHDARLYRAALRDVYSDRHTLTEGGSAISQSIYAPMPIGDGSLETALLQDYTATAMNAAVQERLGLRYTEDLTAVYELLAFRSRADTTQATIVTSAAVPVAALRSNQVDGRGAFRIRFALSSENYAALLTDTVARFALPPAPPGALAAFHAEADVRPGAYEYALRMEGGDAALGAVVAGDENDPTSAPQGPGAGATSAGRLQVPVYDSAAPSISSLVIGYAASAPNTLKRFGSALSLVPTHVLPPDARAVLYYELYGIEPGARLETSIEIAPREDDEDVQVVSFDEEAAHVPGSSVVAATRTLDFSRLATGVHEVTVRVRVGNEEVARTTFVDLSEYR